MSAAGTMSVAPVAASTPARRVAGRSPRVLVTGATGFVGRPLCARLAGEYAVRAAVRCAAAGASLPAGVDAVVVGEVGPQTFWGEALRDVDAVVHLAARVHVLHERDADPASAFRRVNVEGSIALANAAVAAGVRRFVYLSTVRVNGPCNREGPFTEDDTPVTSEPYEASKLDAERALRALAAEAGLEVVILRPPLVYGPGVKANFLRLLRAVDRGLPLPLGAIENRRSLIYVGNLVDAIRACVAHPAASGQTFLVSDGDDVSTPELVRRIAQALGRTPRLVPVPLRVLEAAASVLGRRSAYERLAGSSQIDARGIRDALGWRAPCTMQAGLEATARWYREHRSG